MPSSRQIGHGLAKVFEEQPTVKEVLAGLVPTKKGIIDYFLSLFPFLSWIGFYNLQWLTGDLVAGEANGHD